MYTVCWTTYYPKISLFRNPKKSAVPRLACTCMTTIRILYKFDMKPFFLLSGVVLFARKELKSQLKAVSTTVISYEMLQTLHVTICTVQYDEFKVTPINADAIFAILYTQITCVVEYSLRDYRWHPTIAFDLPPQNLANMQQRFSRGSV